MNNYLPTDYQAFIHTSRYARWLEKEQRRESWNETVERYMDNVVRKIAGNDSYINQIRDAILSLDVSNVHSLVWHWRWFQRRASVH